MAVNDGDKVNQSVTNAAFISRTSDSDTVGKLDVKNADAASGDNVLNVQRELNGLDSLLTDTPTTNGTHDRKFTWSSDAIGSANDGVKERIDAVQAQVETNDTDIADNRTDIDDLRTLTGTVDGDTDLGTFTETIISDNTDIKTALQELETALSAVTDALDFQGLWDADANSPALTSSTGTKGHFYIVSVAGSTNLDGITDWNIGDWAVFDGSVWRQIDNTDAVSSVAGKTGVVTLELSDLTDADTTGEAAGDFLRFNGSDYVPSKNLDVSGAASTTQRLVASSDTNANLTALARKKGAIYFDDTDNNYKGDDGTSLIDLGSGGTGQGGINYIDNPDFESNVNDVNVTANITKDAETTNKIRGTQSLKLTIDTLATTSDNADIIMRDVDAADLGGELFVRFKYATDVNYTSDDVQFVLRNTDSSVDVPIFNDNDGKLEATGGLTTIREFVGRVDIDNVDDSYDLRINVLSAPATDSNIIIDEVRVGPTDVVPGSIQEDWVSFTPTTQGLGTPTIDFAQYKRVGDTILMQVKLTTGTVTASEAQVGLPPNLTIASGYSLDLVGEVQRDAATDAHYTVLGTAGDGFLNFGLRSGSTAAAFTARNGDALWGSTTQVAFTASFKIAEWKSTVLLSSEESLFKNTFVTGAGNGGGAITANVTDVDFTESQDDFNVFDGSQFVAPSSGFYEFDGSVKFTASTAGILQAYIDGTVFSTISTSVSSDIKSFAGTIFLNKGEALSIRHSVGTTLSNSTTEHTINIRSKKDLHRFSELNNPRTVYLKDVKSSGTDGGTATSGSYETRTLNTIEGDTEIASLSSNQFTLQAGKYEIEAFAPAVGVDTHKIKLRNITDSTDDIIGSVQDADNTNVVGNYSHLNGQLILSGPKTFEIQHRVTTTRGTIGHGAAATFGDSEVYTTVKITKVK